jgi:REP element-mobilizing transposase RayT
LASAPVDDFDTRTTLAQAEQNADDFTSVLPEETFTLETVAAENWDTNWNEPEVAAEPAVENFNDVWDAPLEAEAEIENFNVAWDIPESAEPDPLANAETHPVALSEEARIAQLALNLTQVSLEVSAEGTILTRNNQIIALAGHLSQQDTIELATVINNDWGTGGQGARLRFITLPSSGKEYMLYSTGTEDDLILSMIFAGSTPLRVIRQQGQRLIKALGEVPEAKPAAITPAPRRDLQAVEEALEPYAYVWLVRAPEQRLNDAVAQSITVGLMTQLSEMHWQIEKLQVQDEYIYLYANVPGETPSYAVIRELKQRAASIAQKQDSNLEAQELWADSYLVLSPGRELAPDEIQEFVDFQRMM